MTCSRSPRLWILIIIDNSPNTFSLPGPDQSYSTESFWRFYKVDVIIRAFLYLKKLRQREVKWLILGHTAKKQCAWDTNPSSLALYYILSSITVCCQTYSRVCALSHGKNCLLFFCAKKKSDRCCKALSIYPTHMLLLRSDLQARKVTHPYDLLTKSLPCAARDVGKGKGPRAHSDCSS